MSARTLAIAFVTSYSPQMIKCLSQQFETLYISPEEIMPLIFGQYLSEKEAGKRPLAKLTQDLLGEDYKW